MRLKLIYFLIPLLVCIVFTGVKIFGEDKEPLPNAYKGPWRINNSDGKSALNLKSVDMDGHGATEITYELKGGSGFIDLALEAPSSYAVELPVTFFIKSSEVASDLEIKFIAKNGSVYGRKVSLKNNYRTWTQIVVYLNSLEYWWLGNGNFDGLAKFSIALSGIGAGKVWITDTTVGTKDLAPSFPPLGPILDPDRELSGVGFKERRDKELIPEDPLVLEYLKRLQDTASPQKKLLPAMEDNQAQTFNNAMVSMVFVLKGEKENAERILDYYAKAMVKNNPDQTLQNFYYRGEARGFYQYVALRAEGGSKAYHVPSDNVDRWMGDMAWLLIAYKYYEKEYNSPKYNKITKALYKLLVSWFKEDGQGGGYVQHGWRNGDKYLHEKNGHSEGNIDCYAAFKLMGDNARAEKIKNWLDRDLGSRNNLPLDNYTWRVLAFGKESAELLNVPDYDLRYRKTLEVKGKTVMGFYHSADAGVNNIWLDGVGHIACAYLAYGDRERGYFYANQLDVFLFERSINGIKTKALPYTANQEGGYSWVQLDKGFVSVCAWYIFAKNKFNPMTLERF